MCLFVIKVGFRLEEQFRSLVRYKNKCKKSAKSKAPFRVAGKMVEEIAASLPDSALEVIFSYLDLHDLRNCSLVCKKWYSFLNDENNDVWRLHCIRKLAEEALKSDLLSSVPTYKAKLRAFYHAWNPNDCSRNVYIKPNGFTLHRNPVAQSTDASRGKIGFRHGRHAWEVIWEGPLGTVAVIGIATKEAPLQCHGYVALLGSDDQSWGWNLVDNHLLHNGDSQGNYPLLNNAPKYQVAIISSSTFIEYFHFASGKMAVFLWSEAGTAYHGTVQKKKKKTVLSGILILNGLQNNQNLANAKRAGKKKLQDHRIPDSERQN
ncbi:unnamed protein product [Nezara viridula]|uniref:F-box/SPRY domain-containing protein 1 n=1 Tax=Nezara viridula TaxID=85310 RepID=A0A9P0MKA0_NEZVI|nr:unnamed protein product [Nezara viridula]